MRARTYLSLGLCLGAFGCFEGEGSPELELSVRAEEEILSVRVIVLRNDETARRVNEQIFAARRMPGDPVEIRLRSERDVVVQLRADTADGRTLVAVRCYSGGGLTRDPNIVLQAISATMDTDDDGWVAPAFAETICRDQGFDALDTVPCAFGCPAGLSLGSDCNDSVDTIYPGAPPICEDGIDQTCTGMDEPCEDQDGDGWTACGPDPIGPCDCDDLSASINPDISVDPTESCGGAASGEACVPCRHGVDQNCDGAGSRCDLDGDGYVASRATGGVPDCDDTDPNVYPGAPEICNGRDNDCNGLIDDGIDCLGADADGDGSDACAFVLDADGEYVLDEDGRPLLEDGDCDCNDCDAGIRPGFPEICGNGIDDNCNGEIDEGCPEHDMDSDGFAPPLDCNDMDPVAYPGSPFDRCENGFAEDCETSDRSCADDLDGDGFIEPAVCDTDPNVNPDVEEICDGIDNNCSPVPNPTGSGEVFVVDEVGDRPHRSASGEIMYPPGTWGCVRGVGVARAVSFRSDPMHCGGCRVSCPSDRADACVDGVCDCTHEDGVASCALGSVCCVDGCVDTATDPSNCGACGTVCDIGESCAEGRCT